MKEFLSENSIEFDYVDICSSIYALKEFMKLRDTSDSHKEVRELHSVGVPSIVVNDNVYICESIDYVKSLIEEGKLNLR